MLVIIIFVVFTHILIYFSYPDTTLFGFAYLFASNLLWIGFFGFLNISIRNLNYFTRSFLKFFFYFIMLYITIIFYPQRDGKSVFDKIADGKYPDKYSFYRGYRGLKRFFIK
jgi:hypothetical protein